MSNILTYTDIANMAIDWNGGSLSIFDINDEHNPDAIVCKRNIKQAIVSELDKYEWAFARKVIAPLRDMSGEHDIPGYITYILPDDFSRLSMYLFAQLAGLLVINEYNKEVTYFVRGKYLYSKTEVKCLAYNSNSVPIAEWPSLFSDCVALNLAQRIAGKLKGMDADIAFLEQMYKTKLKDARRCELITTEANQGGESILQIQRMI